MQHGGKRVGAGRPQGSRNFMSSQREALIGRSGPTPLDVLIGAMRYHYGVANDELAKSNPKKREVRAALASAVDAAHRAAALVHAKVHSMGDEKLDLEKLSYEELSIVVSLLRKCNPYGPEVNERNAEEGILIAQATVLKAGAITTLP
jgi:exopolyphosphatase/pppGpp-phosphohydrolase